MLAYSDPRERQGALDSSMPRFPSQQLFILALCRICEPIAFMSIFPYTYYMVVSFKVTTDDRQISVYAGMITSAFAFAEFSSSVLWGKLSDRVGRKPVLISGLAGTLLSMLLFGFAPSLPVALLGRALGGLLNGNIGVLQTTVAEIVTVKEHQPRAYAIMPFVWCLGSILGPAIGGALAQPCENYPSVFARGSILDRFPFLLPNLVCAAILAMGVLIGLLFLEETHAEKKHRRDIGLEIGRWIIRQFVREPLAQEYDKAEDANMQDLRPLLRDEDPPGYCTTEGTPHRQLSRTQSPVATARMALDIKVKEGLERKSGGIHTAFTKQVILNIVAYGMLAYHTMSFDTMLPLLLSTPTAQEPPSLPFQFTGGLGLSSKMIGFMLSLQGVYSMLAQLFLFPVAASRFGSLKTFRLVVMLWPMLYLAVPYLILLPERFQLAGVYFCLLWRVTAQVLAYPSHAILLTNSAPSMLVLGVINGVAASTASLMRALGPTFSGIIYTAGLKVGCAGLVFWVSGFVSVLGAIESLWVGQTGGRMDKQEASAARSEADEALIDPLAVNAAIIAAHRPESGFDCDEHVRPISQSALSAQERAA